jgi:SAM-dependent methyltransferase
MEARESVRRLLMGKIYATDPTSARDLERRLFEFYGRASDYFAEAEAGEGNRFHLAIEPLARRLAVARGRLAVLEPGAGRTTLPIWLRSLGLTEPVHLTVQDVTAINSEYLNRVADAVLLGPLQGHELAGKFDLIVCTFVYEHLVDPRTFLDTCLEALRPGGALVIFSPKYTVPGYVPPALRHLAWGSRHWETFKNSMRALSTYLTRRSAFRIVERPAVFEGAWYRDADAVHLVHPLDARLHLRGRAVAEPISIQMLSLKDKIWQVLGLHAQIFHKF